MSKLKLRALLPNARNPRKISDKKLQMLQASLRRFGDLSGIVVNQNSDRQIVGGHQRVRAYQDLKADDIVIEREYDEPTKTGTVCEGYVRVDGERHSYREVRWDEATEKAANLAANKGAGEFDLPLVADMLRELAHLDIDPDLTMFTPSERDTLLGADLLAASDAAPAEPKPQATTLCPSCGHEF